MALAARIDGLGREVIHFIEAARRIQTEAIAKAVSARSAGLPIPPDALAIMATSLALTLTRETELGVSLGHAGALEVVARVLDSLEPD